jgi:hypothetical protein
MTNYSTANSKKVVLRKSQTLNSKRANSDEYNFFLGLLIGKITLVHLARSEGKPFLKHL